MQGGVGTVHIPYMICRKHCREAELLAFFLRVPSSREQAHGSRPGREFLAINQASRDDVRGIHIIEGACHSIKPVAIAKVPPLDSPTSARRAASPPKAQIFVLAHFTAARQS